MADLALLEDVATVPSKQHFTPLFHLANDNFYFTLSQVTFLGFPLCVCHDFAIDEY